MNHEPATPSLPTRGLWSAQVLETLQMLTGKLDARVAIACILFSYNVLGFTVLGFNRSPWQMLITTLLVGLAEVLLCYFVHRKWVFPLSALITSFSLSLLLNFSHTYWLLPVPVFFAIGSKYLLTYKGKHFFNPALMGVCGSLFFAGDLITAAPAYQWNGIENFSVFMVLLALVFLLPKINRHYLVVSFLAFFTAQTFLRAMIMRHHLPFETLFLGTLSSPSFILFTFFMITDPATSPKTRKDQVIVGASLALVDLAYHLKQSYFTFFYAGFTVAFVRFVYFHYKDWIAGLRPNALYLRKLQGAAIIGALSFMSYAAGTSKTLLSQNLNWRLQSIPGSQSGFEFEMGDLYTRVDPKIQHIIKWLFSVGDSVAVGDYNQDGLVDVFLTNMLKRDQDRALLLKNVGGFKFERVPVPGISDVFATPEKSGVPSNALFIDYDNDSDLDLLISVAFGATRLYRNELQESGRATYTDITGISGLESYTNSVSANFLDFNRDGLLDLFVANVWPDELPDYKTPTLLNLFDLPEPEHANDDRPFNFMHASWHMSTNGGVNTLYLQNQDHTFSPLNSQAIGMPETHWSLAVGSADFNRDGWPDLYVANDFGPDDLYLNEQGARLKNIKGGMFGSIGRDTYKGMNVSIADIDRNGFLDVYVSNVHHALQAEGSLLWLFSEDKNGGLKIEDRATELGALNENRFGWGASLEDFNLDGWVDIVQANGMVNDQIDKKYDSCPDYWYVNEKIARSPPEIHRYANKWGDIRGMCIYGNEKNRVYLNQGKNFVDVSDSLGMTDSTNSRGVAAADFDNDGRKDLLITHMFESPTLYQNTLKPGAQASNWIGFSFQGNGTTCNRMALGSRVEIRQGIENPPIQVQEVQAATSFSAQSDSRMVFGLGDFQGAVQVNISWCGGVQETRILASNRYHVIKMGVP